jgi:hypothetical protein
VQVGYTGRCLWTAVSSAQGTIGGAEIDKGKDNASDWTYKTIVFGLLKRGYKVYTQIIEKCDRNTLQTIISLRFTS